MDVRLPDGTVIRDVPDGTTREELSAKLKANGYNLEEPAPKQERGTFDKVMSAARMISPVTLLSNAVTPEGRADIGNAIAGGTRGAGSIGATLMIPVDAAAKAAGVQNHFVGRNDRRVAMDNALTTMGADTKSVPFQTAKLATEVGGTYPIGGVVGGAVSKVAPRLGTAITSAGMSTGSRVAPSVLNQLADLGIRSAGSAINAGLTAGAIDPAEAPLAMGVAGTIPVVTKVAGATGHMIGQAVSPRYAQQSAARKVGETLGDQQAAQAIADIQTYYPKGAENIPVSAAAVTGNPALAQLEQGSRLRAAPQWWEFDQKQGKAVFDNVMNATKEAEELGARKGLRAENWQQAWAKASEAQKPRVWQQRMTQFGADLEQAMQSPESSNPAVRQVLEAINSEFDRVGPNFTPAHLQQIRANLNGKANSMSPDVFKAAPRDNPAIISLIKELDDILNASTGGKWQKVIEGYAKDSEAVRASAAAGKVRGAFIDAATGRPVKTTIDAAGDIPAITQAGLNGAMNAARLPDKSLALSGEANARLEATLDALRRQGMVQSVKKAATAGGGSDTIHNALASGAADAAGAPNMLLQLVGAVKKLGTGKTDAEMARLLSNPDELANVLRRYLAAPQAPNRIAVGVNRLTPALVADR